MTKSDLQYAYEMVMKIVMAIICLSVLVGGCSYLNKRFGVDDDNMFEEFFEKQVENQTGIDIDFTPDSPE